MDKLAAKQARADRLKQARINAGYGKIAAAVRAHGWKLEAYKAHESGRNGFEDSAGRSYARAFRVSLAWLMTGEGEPGDVGDSRTTTDVPLISWVSAGHLLEQDGVDLSEFPTVAFNDLPEGDWVAFRVEGPSMNKISPPDSIIAVNRRDKRLVPNACYVIADERGSITYKRYRPNETPPFQPASYEKIEPLHLEDPITVIGRVRRSLITL